MDFITVIISLYNEYSRYWWMFASLFVLWLSIEITSHFASKLKKRMELAEK